MENAPQHDPNLQNDPGFLHKARLVFRALSRIRRIQIHGRHALIEFDTGVECKAGGMALQLASDAPLSRVQEDDEHARLLTKAVRRGPAVHECVQPKAPVKVEKKPRARVYVVKDGEPAGRSKLRAEAEAARRRRS
jgi:hypothetical protein